MWYQGKSLTQTRTAHWPYTLGPLSATLEYWFVQGNGKSTRAERAAYIFPEGWTTTGGQSSEKSGQNGQSDACDGKNVFYDEMVPELMNPEATNKIEYWKQILSARQYTSARTVCIKDPNGQDTHRTAQIRTPHNETHLMYAPP